MKNLPNLIRNMEEKPKDYVNINNEKTFQPRLGQRKKKTRIIIRKRFVVT